MQVGKKVQVVLVQAQLPPCGGARVRARRRSASS